MSRVLLLSMDERDVIAKCHAAKVGVSAIERLPSGGVRLVCNAVSGAEQMRKTLKKHLIAGDVVRERHRPVKPLW